MANQMAKSMGYGMRIGFAVVLAGQVLLYGFWAGVAQTAKLKREELAAIKKSVKKPKREELTAIKKSVKKSKK
jgi:hypothetical protein